MRKALGASILFFLLCFFLQRIFLGRGAGLGVSYVFSCSVYSYLTCCRQTYQISKKTCGAGLLAIAAVCSQSFALQLGKYLFVERVVSGMIS